MTDEAKPKMTSLQKQHCREASKKAKHSGRRKLKGLDEDPSFAEVAALALGSLTRKR